MIFARPQQYQGGYCGNYNGHVKDDYKVWGRIAAGTRLDPIDAGEDMFKKAGYKNTNEFALLQSDDNRSQFECSEELKKKAKAACSSIPEKTIRDGCEFDVCNTNDTSFADQAMEMELMNVAFGKGSVEYQGQGTCLDSSGAPYSTLAVQDVSDELECRKLLHELSHHWDSVKKGVRGAQFKKNGGEDGSCDILIDATEKGDVELFEEIPAQLSGLTPDVGSGIVSQTDGLKSVTCWKIMI